MFITAEGIDGSGKTTFLRNIAGHLQKNGISHLLTAEPTARPEREFSEEQEELAFFLEDRKKHNRMIITPTLAEKKIVLCDRYHDSTIAYQGYGRGFPLTEIENLATGCVLEPDLTFLLDLDAVTAKNRALLRNRRENDEILIPAFDNQDMDFYQRVRQGYLSLAEKNHHRFIVLDARLTPERLLELALLHLKTRNASLFAN